MSKLLDGLECVVCHMDDVLVVGRDQEQHDARLPRCSNESSQELTLNAAKCEFSKASVKFLGHCVSKGGVRADPDKTAAICRMEPPCFPGDLRSSLWGW